VVDAPLYTKYIKKADEYRVHVFDGEVIDVQQKRKRQEVENEDVDYQIRNSTGGWVFCRAEVDIPDICLSMARRAVSALGLTFGAVDIGYNRREDMAYVFEVNTAPGLEGTTLDTYYAAIEKKLPQIKRGMYAKRRAV
jgi:glutathione synthase/RimK-type ligase-like ATP-grasp enzyme